MPEDEEVQDPRVAANSADDDDDGEQARAEKLARIFANFTFDSAYMVCYERYLETSKGEEALFRDTFAKHLMGGDKGREISDLFGQHSAPHFGLWPEYHKDWTAVRTKFIDEHLERLKCDDDNNDETRNNFQYVNLGAGLDTRCYRLEVASQWRGAYDVDVARINEPKRQVFTQVLKAEPKVENYQLLSVDLKQRGLLTSTLESVSFDGSHPTIFLAEGIIHYVGGVQDQTNLLGEISLLAAPKSVLILNYADPKYVLVPSVSKEQIQAELEKNGWTNLQFNMFGDKVLNYGRFKEGYEPCAGFSFVVATMSDLRN